MYVLIYIYIYTNMYVDKYIHAYIYRVVVRMADRARVTALERWRANAVEGSASILHSIFMYK